MRINESDMRKRREVMIDQAFQLFCERGIEDVKMSEIAKRSGAGEATIYRYFGNKEQLVLEAFVKLWEMIMGKVYESVAGTDDYASLSGYEQIKTWIEAFRYLYQNKGEFVLFSYEAKLYFLRHKITLNKFQQDALMQAFHEPCLAALEKGKQDGSILAHQENEDLFYAIWGTIRGYVVKIVIYDKLYKEDSPWESRYQIVMDGILSALKSGWNAENTSTQI